MVIYHIFIGRILLKHSTTTYSPHQQMELQFHCRNLCYPLGICIMRSQVLVHELPICFIYLFRIYKIRTYKGGFHCIIRSYSYGKTWNNKHLSLIVQYDQRWSCRLKWRMWKYFLPTVNLTHVPSKTYMNTVVNNNVNRNNPLRIH